MELLNEMLAHLASLFGGEVCDVDAHAAIYWYASHYHGGQASALYGVLSVSPFRPGPMLTLEREDEFVQMLYAELVAHYEPKGG